MTNQREKWRRYEDLVARIQRELAPLGAEITQDERIVGVFSEVQRQIDVAVRITVDGRQLLTVIDAKDRARPIDVKAVEEFMGLVEDVEANKGILVASNGFSAASRRRARAAGIDLFSSVDVESTDWPTYLSFPCVVIFCSPLVSFSLEFGVDFHGSIDMAELPTLPLFDENGNKIGTPCSIFTDYWNNEEVNLDADYLTVESLVEYPILFRTEDVSYPLRLGAKVRVHKNFYFGQLPLTSARGFADVEPRHDGLITLRTHSVTTDWLRFDDVQANWKKIESTESLAVHPTLFVVTANVLDESGQVVQVGGA